MDTNQQRQDIATVFSLLPVAIKETKPGLYPGEYSIPAVTERGDFNLLVINEGVHYVPQLEHQPYRATTSPKEIAHSIVQDYIEGCMGLDEGAAPGLFWEFGLYSKELAKVQLSKRIHDANTTQNRWFMNLVKIGDIEWAQNPGNHNVITVLMRHAARALGMEKEWLVNPDALELIYCPVCRNNVSSKAIMCGACRAILKPEEYRKFQFANGSSVTFGAPEVVVNAQAIPRTAK